MKHCDAIIIGSGQGGVPLALALARGGKSVVVFERGSLGGTCVNRGCTPSKAFLAAAHSVGRARRARKLGLTGDVSLDFPKTMTRVGAIVAEFRAGVERRLAEAGVAVVRGEAHFTAPRTVRCNDESATAPLVVINTGTVAAIPPIPGLADEAYLTNATFFAQHDLPRRFAVIGGGYIGLELGQGMARAGAEVHIIHRAARLLDAEEPDASAALARSLIEDGVTLHLATTVARVGRADGALRIVLADGTPIACDRILVTTGRSPNTAALNAEAAGIRLDARGYVAVSPSLETTSPGVYAIGDVAGQPAFTHVAWEDHRRLLETLEGRSRHRDDRVLAYATYTEPQVARAGLTLEAARARGIAARAVTLPLTSAARAIEWGEDNGFYRVVIDGDTGRIVGATLVGYETAELVHVLLTYIQAGLTWRDLERSVHVHPTYAEALPALAREFAHA